MLTYQGSDMRGPQYDPVELFAAKVAGSFRIEAAPDGRVILSVTRNGEVQEVIVCATAAEANRHRQRLSDQGLAGFVSNAR